MFISVRWKVIALVSLLLVGISGYFIVNSERELKKLLDSQRRDVFLSYQNEIVGLLRQSYDHLLQLSDILPILESGSNDEAAQPLDTLIDLHWDYISLNWGMESAQLFDDTENLISQWGYSRKPSTSATVKKVLETGMPVSRLICIDTCQQVVTLPIISPDQQVMVLEFSTSLADTLRAFQQITQTDIGVLVSANGRAGDLRVVQPWSKRLAAMTHLQESMAILQEAAEQVSFATLQKQPQVFQRGEAYYEVSLVDLKTQSLGDAFFIIIEDMTHQHQQIFHAKQEAIRTALTSIILSGLLFLFAFWTAVIRLRGHAEILPILAERDFKLIREKLGGKKRWRFFRDELDVLDEAELRVADQLETMQLQIEKDTQRLESLALYDSLTQLANRHKLFKEIQQAVKESAHSDLYFGLLYLDLDNFKHVNDSLGHSVGDEVLKVAARRLQAGVREHDIVARLGGDEFCVLVKQLKRREDSGKVAENILAVLAEPVKLGTAEFIISASIGIVTIPDHGMSTEQLLQNADIAMYRAKAEGRSNYRFYDAQMSVVASQRMAMETQLRRAVAENQFELHYQPQVDLVSGKVVSAEALVRWLHPERGMIPPDDFIPLLEETGLITSLGEWIVKQACLAAKSWAGVDGEPINIAINLSPRQFADPKLPQIIRDAMAESSLMPSQIEIEITESMVMSNIEESNQLLKYLQDLGVSIAIDDFGTGHSSLAYLKKLDIDVLKIDRTFVQDLPDDENDKAIVAAIIAMAHELKLKVVAEGIESLEQESFLKEHGCEMGQGYLYSKPLPNNKFVELLKWPDNIVPFKRSS